MGTNCAPLLANLFLYSYEVEFLRSMKKSNKKLAKAFNSTSRYIDDLISINNPRFKPFLKDIYPEKLVVSETPESRNVVSYLDLLIPDLSRSIPAALAYGTYIAQLIRYSQGCHSYENFSSRQSMLAERLFNQGFSVRKLILICRDVPTDKIQSGLPQLWELFFSTVHACRKTFQPRFFCEKTDENYLQIYGQISRTCINVQQESIINDMW